MRLLYGVNRLEIDMKNTVNEERNFTSLFKYVPSLPKVLLAFAVLFTMFAVIQPARSAEYWFNADRTSMLIAGPIGDGEYHKFLDNLEPTVTRIDLTGPGGQYFNAALIGIYIYEHHFDTFAFEHCSS